MDSVSPHGHFLGMVKTLPGPAWERNTSNLAYNAVSQGGNKTPRKMMGICYFHKDVEGANNGFKASQINPFHKKKRR